MKNKVVPFPTNKRPQSARLDAVTLDVSIRHQRYGQLVRAAALFDTSIADVLERVLEKAFGKESQPPTGRAA